MDVEANSASSTSPSLRCEESQILRLFCRSRGDPPPRQSGSRTPRPPEHTPERPSFPALELEIPPPTSSIADKLQRYPGVIWPDPFRHPVLRTSFRVVDEVCWYRPSTQQHCLAVAPGVQGPVSPLPPRSAQSRTVVA